MWKHKITSFTDTTFSNGNEMQSIWWKSTVNGGIVMKATGIVRRIEECVIIGQKLSKPV